MPRHHIKAKYRYFGFIEIDKLYSQTSFETETTVSRFKQYKTRVPDKAGTGEPVEPTNNISNYTGIGKHSRNILRFVIKF